MLALPPGADRAAVLADLRANGSVAWAEPDDRVQATAIPDDPAFVDGSQWALRNNGRGLAGIAWKVQLMTGRFLASDGSGTVSDAITCIEYARVMGARIINASWVGTNYSAALELAVAKARDDGVLLVAAAGNDGADNDGTPYYPANLALENVIAVGATTRRDVRWTRSNFGASTVHLMAPGEAIYSSFFIGDNNYVSMTGTSTAAPHVAGAAALVWAAFPAASYREVRDRILRGADRVPGLAGTCRTGGRLNVGQALDPGPFTVAPWVLAASRGNVGGPFNLAQRVFTLSNYGHRALEWSAEVQSDWITLSAGSGSLASGGSTEVVATLGPGVGAMLPGSYTNRLTFSADGVASAPVEVAWELQVHWPATLSIERTASTSQLVAVNLAGEAGVTYVLERTTNGAVWRAQATNALPEGGEWSPVATQAVVGGWGFYRARRVP